MKQIKASEINQTIAELLEPKPTSTPVITGRISLTVMTDISTVSMAWRYDFRLNDWQPLDFLHDPRGTVMLIKAMHNITLREQPEGQWCAISDLSGFIRPPSLEEAVARAFLR